MTQPFTAIVLAAGQGTRMKSATPKVLHPIAGRPLLAWAVDAVRGAGAERCIVVLGHERETIRSSLEARYGADWLATATQEQQLGTGHAVRCGLDGVLAESGYVIVTYGDCPLVRPETLAGLVEAATSSGRRVALLTGELAEPKGYGRILRDDQGRIVAIREDRDLSEEQRAIREVNPGVYAFEVGFLREALTRLSAKNAQGELYLTDVVELAAGSVVDVRSDMEELRGINDRYELALCDDAMQDRIRASHARSGVTMRNPGSIRIEAEVTIEPDVVLESGVVLRGRTRIGAGAVVDVGCVLTNVVVGRGVHLKPYTVAAESVIHDNAQVGPFSHLRPQSELGPESHVGNFVETKKTKLGRGAKANHLAYLGDGDIGDEANIGAGTIFCNYDGFRKHTTVIESGAFIGSDSQLVAPVRIGRNAYVATGTTVTRDVPNDALAISRTPQKNKEGYAPPLRAKLRGQAPTK